MRVSAGIKGPANTFTHVHVWDLRLTGEQPLALPLPEGYTTLLVVLKGSAQIGAEKIGGAEVGIFDRTGDHIRIDSARDATALLLCGEPIDGPIVGSDPFVMNRPEQIKQAIEDYQSGRMGHLG
ncbi:MAG TPA: pirin-like C-terminal cupin domain-containing protein [Nitrosospira sp.]|nr:pirin-like C-terminal cupin domain-containing protein [Nitrosospira sp.]